MATTRKWQTTYFLNQLRYGYQMKININKSKMATKTKRWTTYFLNHHPYVCMTVCASTYLVVIMYVLVYTTIF